MKKIIRNTTSFMFLLLTAACFLTHNDVYEQNITRKQLNFCTKTYNRKKWSLPITYYSNHDASYKLLISGDIELNPAPNSGNRVGNQGDANIRAPKCNPCYKKVRTNSKRLMCEDCKLLVHLNCADVNLTIENSKIARLWICHACTLRELPLHHQDVLPMNKKEVAAENYINAHVTKLQELKTHISICHLNTQLMTPTFDEFQFIVNESKFDIITLSETWLKNDKHLLEYVNLPGYKSSNKNRDEKRGGGVGVYIKDRITYKIRNDKISLEDSLEHLWVEIKGKNKKSSYLIGVAYQPSSENAKKIEWIEKIDAASSSIKSTWASTIILAGDTNIDLLSSSMTRDMYEQMLHTYQYYTISCHITKPTRKGKKLIDHISSNICKNKILHSGVLPCATISDHDAPYIIVNIPTNKYEIRYKFIRNLKHFDFETYINDFKTPFATVYSFNETDDQ